MRTNRLVLGLLILALLVTVLAAAAKLRATPKYDRIQEGMSAGEIAGILGPPDRVDVSSGRHGLSWDGTVLVTVDPTGDLRVDSKIIKRRGPLERLAWLAGWR